MSHSRNVAAAIKAAAASPVAGASPHILDAWLLVRRRAFLTIPKRRYVVLTEDHVLMIDSTPVLHLVDCQLSSNSSSRVIDLTPAPNCGIPYRIFADSPFQYSKWRAALQASATASIRRYYRIDSSALIGVGVHGIIRRAYPEVPFRDDSIASSTSMSEYSVHTNNTRSLSIPRFLQKSASANSYRRSTPVILPQTHSPSQHFTSSPDPALQVPATNSDKRLLRNTSHKSMVQHHNRPPTPPSQPLSVAVKTVSRTGDGTVSVASDILFAKARLQHFAIINVLDIFETVNEVHIVMEECMGGSLTQYVSTNGPLSHSLARSLFSPLLKAVGFLHASGVVHWDICPNNVLFLHHDLPLELKLIDFSTCRPINPANGRVPPEHTIFFEKGKVSSLSCASPELLTSKAHRYAAKADMWQLGCVLYFLLVGKLPFSHRYPQDASAANTILTFCKLRSAERHEFLFSPSYIGNIQLKTSSKELIMKLLCPNPRMRPNALQCIREYSFLSHSRS
ncbi:Sperm motility kinase 2B [Gracilariopsis chorda]|uniref:Sperm motility kinase 2B n=1 Tax=Gracilariopsis chorda TaxID=448386 RepID=A0A2V3IET9_9FLOR|nr:Sperm motility kinase 2B [Gracilariopsis chorda]|eukprot:PXF40587.1 Sperm motility kinase 2B [Gracilariopsis chorda]